MPWIVVESLPTKVAAGTPKQIVSAVVNGHKLKFQQKQLTSGRTGDGVSIVGGMRPRRLHQVLESLTVTCAQGPVAGVFPAPGHFRILGYSEVKFAKGLATKQWQGESDSVQVTFESFDGTRLQGTFQGTLAPLDPNTGYGPVPVRNGVFTVIFGN